MGLAASPIPRLWPPARLGIIFDTKSGLEIIVKRISTRQICYVTVPAKEPIDMNVSCLE
jgi:hypothetical protein